MRPLVTAVLSVSAGNYAAIAAGIVTNILLARALGAAEYGRLALLLMASGIMAVVASTWTLTGLIRFGAQEYADRRTVAGSLLARIVIVVPSLAIVAIVTWVLGGPLSAYLDTPTATLAIVLFHATASALSQSVGGVFQAAERMTVYGASLFVDRIAVLGAVTALAIAGPFDAADALLTVTLGVTLSSLGGLAFAAHLGLLARGRLDPAGVSALWRFSLPQLGGSWAGVFGSQWIDYVIIRRYLSLGDLGIYALAFQIAGTVQQMATIVATVMLPRYSALVAGGAHEAIRGMLAFGSLRWIVAFAGGAGVLLALAGPVVPLVFGVQFAAVTLPLSLLLVASCAVAVFSTLNPALAAYGIVWPVTGAVLVSVSVNIALDLVLIPPFGIAGSAIATVVAYSVSATIVLAVARARLGAPPMLYALCVTPAPVALAAGLLSGGSVAITTAAAVMTASALALLLRRRERTGRLDFLAR